MTGDKDTLRGVSMWGDGLPTAEVPPAPSLACLQQKALDEKGNEVAREIEEPRGDGKSLAHLA